ncbi:hypothetical protein WJX81_005161 [Elliptochloris bilobata]|uniref:Heat shock protein 70 n=1 Tax=Elliptochloris bilobata TaxID=381761 RepID=A0AAW1R0S0_9CHLO
MRLWSFNVVRSATDKPLVSVDVKGDTRLLTPEQVVAQLLRHVKVGAEAHLDTSVEGVVITCPAAFTSAQREALHAAATMAGLRVLRLLDEPIAAALAIIGDTPNVLKPAKQDIPRAVVIFNIGGGSCDACFMEVDQGVLEAKATVASTVVSGEAFDARLVYHLAELFERATALKPLTSRKATQRLRLAASKAKELLSTSEEARVRSAPASCLPASC